uniref:Uncharacterized protein n=1 Tax=Arundo donax TaxID=35708 RepID=A0A0A9A5Q8_ARUDO
MYSVNIEKYDMKARGKRRLTLVKALCNLSL